MRQFLRKLHKLVKRPDAVDILWSNNQKSTFHYVWLKDNCLSPQSLHPTNKQKLHSSGDIPVTIQPESVELNEQELILKWTDSTSTFPLDWLKKHDYTNKRPKLIEPVVWDAKKYQRRYKPVDYTVFANTDDGLMRVLMDLRDYGLSFLRNVPVKKLEQVEQVARRFGPVQETFYGPSWDVKSVPDSKNIAYTSLYLGLHMDLMYFESPPGIQMLHCLKNSVTGGESLFLDIYGAVHLLKQESPEDYEILTQVPVTFHYDNDGHYMHYVRPTIVEDDINDGLKVYYAPPFQGPLQAAVDQVSKFYKAFSKFEEILKRPELTFKILLKPGDCVLFLNQRVLHGREAFDASSGERHLRGTYVQLDDFKDRLRVYDLGTKSDLETLE
ncbi:hypothetical protein EDD86DRAFT_185603 [Gorgonomyces haynaldii]|nr:hypothetical protein EDD86DRAFT_185603 [Gorgonomyces haynaldii]